MRFLFLLALMMVAVPFSAVADAKHTQRAKAKHTWHKLVQRPDRDCVPYNGPYGYYGNPWCDTGSSRPPDVEFRERHRLQKR